MRTLQRNFGQQHVLGRSLCWQRMLGAFDFSWALCKEKVQSPRQQSSLVAQDVFLFKAPKATNSVYAGLKPLASFRKLSR